MDLIALIIGASVGGVSGVAWACWRLRGSGGMVSALRAVIERTGGQGEER